MYSPYKVLLRRLFFIDVDRTRYMSVGYYPARDYQPLVEFGASKKNGSTVLIIDDRQVAKLAECLPRICESMCANEQCGCSEGSFRLTTTATGGVARMYVDKQFISFRLADLQYMARIFHVVRNQLNVYTLSLPDVLAYATVALTSPTYIEPSLPTASKHIVYPQLFDELKTMLLN